MFEKEERSSFKLAQVRGRFLVIQVATGNWEVS